MTVDDATPRPRAGRSLWSGVWCAIAIPAGVLVLAWGGIDAVVSGSVYDGPDLEADAQRLRVLTVAGAGLAATAIVALAARRWIALGVVVLLGSTAGVFALELHERVAPPVDAPAVREPMPCQCRSGGVCECPGG